MVIRARGGWLPPNYTTEDLTLAFCAAIQVPMSVVDGRPWVPTEAEADTGGGAPCND